MNPHHDIAYTSSDDKTVYKIVAVRNGGKWIGHEDGDGKYVPGSLVHHTNFEFSWVKFKGIPVLENERNAIKMASYLSGEGLTRDGSFYHIVVKCKMPKNARYFVATGNGDAVYYVTDTLVIGEAPSLWGRIKQWMKS